MRGWLLTNTTYGTWLPGDPRGSVTSVRDRRATDEPGPVRIEHDVPGQPWEDDLPRLCSAAIKQMKSPPICLDFEKAEITLNQFRETARYRAWTLHAVAIMPNHFHIALSVNDDPEPRKILADFKAYASRTLNTKYGKPPSETWWTTNGSKRKLKSDEALTMAIQYVVQQPRPLVVWSLESGRLV
jgi:REP element-mobilizing transposase RayT